MSESAGGARGTFRALGRFLEIQNLGLNLAFAVAFLLVASEGLPSAWTTFLIVVAFVAARNAGHSFNRWADRALDAANPRTQHRALVVGRLTPAQALAIAAASGGVVILAAYFLNPLAFALSPVALALVYGYSYTKRFTTLTTAFLGLVEAAVPVAIFIAVQGRIPLSALVAAVGMIFWGTAFETIHSLGDLESDRQLGLHSIPVALGEQRSILLIPCFHALALVAFVGFGFLVGLNGFYFGALAVIAGIAAWTDLDLRGGVNDPSGPFRRHFLMAGIFLLGVALALFAPIP